MSDDEDFQRALALSLQDSYSNATATASTIGHDDDAAFEADLQRAIAASKAEYSPAQYPAPEFLSERAQLEKSRIERLKRLRGDQYDEEARPPKRQRLPSSSASRVRADASSSATASPSNTSINTGEQLFWDAEVRQTACRFSEPRADGRPTFRLTEILGKKSDLACALISSYALDLPWIYTFFDPAVPVVLVSHTTGESGMRYAFPNWVEVRPALPGGRGCMHMKFMLLFYKSGRLRIVVSTANLIAFDWRDIENTVWVQDVPRVPHSITSKSSSKTKEKGKEKETKKQADDFPTALTRVLTTLGADRALELLRRDHPTIPSLSPSLGATYDFSRVRAELVPSLAGRHTGWPAVLRTGHTALMIAVRAIGGRRGRGGVGIEYQGSSIGQYTPAWLHEFLSSARGASPQDWLDDPKAKRTKMGVPKEVQVVFPSARTVKGSALGEAGGGTIFCSKRQWDAARFPKEIFVDSKSKGGLVLMHSKMIVATYSGSEEDENTATETDDEDDGAKKPKDAGWAYIGSHNFTPSAWGNLSGSAFNPVMNNTNYEIGVLFPLPTATALDRIACFKRPGRRYDKGERPWIQEESDVLAQVRAAEG